MFAQILLMLAVLGPMLLVIGGYALNVRQPHREGCDAEQASSPTR